MVDYNLNKDVPNFEHMSFVNNHKEIKVMSTDIELITIRECTQLIPGLSYYTVRSLIERGEIQAFRTGKGKGGKSSFTRNLSSNSLRKAVKYL